MSKAKSTATLDSLRAKTDPRLVARDRILKQLAALKARGAEYQRDKEFLVEAGVSQQHSGLVRAEFSKHQAKITEVGKKGSYVVWFPNPADAATIRKEQEQVQRLLNKHTEE